MSSNETYSVKGTINIDALIDRVVADKIEVQITIEPNRTEVSVMPWKPYEMKCPYGCKND